MNHDRVDIVKKMQMSDDMDKAVAKDDYLVTAGVFIGTIAKLREELEKSIHEVFFGVKKKALKRRSLACQEN
ncbi:MAG: hypothetical protein HUJ74_00450 [Lachnospiraceae bacterium]|nr:hypothetical protein [Lachnospiraceae bacterium]